MKGEVAAHSRIQAVEQPKDRGALSAEVRASQGKCVAAGFNQLVERHTPVTGFGFVLMDFISDQSLEASAGFVLDVFGDGPTTYTGVFKEWCFTRTCTPDGVAILVQLTAAIPVDLSARYLRTAEAAMFLEDIDLGDRDALRIDLHLTTLRASVDDLGLAFHLDWLCFDHRPPASTHLG